MTSNVVLLVPFPGETYFAGRVADVAGSPLWWSGRSRGAVGWGATDDLEGAESEGDRPGLLAGPRPSRVRRRRRQRSSRWPRRRLLPRRLFASLAGVAATVELSLTYRALSRDQEIPHCTGRCSRSDDRGHYWPDGGRPAHPRHRGRPAVRPDRRGISACSPPDRAQRHPDPAS